MKVQFLKRNDTFTIKFSSFLSMPNSANILNFNKLFNNHYQQFIYFGLGYVKDVTKAQDFVSDAFATYWECNGSLASETNALGYILTIVKKECLNHLQHKKGKFKFTSEPWRKQPKQLRTLNYYLNTEIFTGL